MGRHKQETAASQFLERRARPFNPKDAGGDLLELLDMCVQALQDARASTREAALTALAGALEALPPLDDLQDSRCFNIFALCGVCIRDGSSSPKEARLAYRVVGLLALTLRAGAPKLLAESFPRLSRTLREEVDAPTLLVVAALDCLAAVTFAGARGKEEVELSMKAIWDVIFFPPATSRRSTTKLSGTMNKTRPPQVLVAAVSTWTFLLTAITSVAEAPPRKADRNATIASLAGLLDNEDRTVRIAAGEALAVCAELNLTPGKGMEALAVRVSDLAAEAAGKGVDNTMLPEQKELFRQIAAFLERNERPDKSLPASSDGLVALKVSTWAKLVQLNFLRRFLGSGFVKHVQGNELFREAFSYGADEGKRLSISKKKQGSKMKEEKDLKAKRYGAWDWNIFCDYPYTLRRKPEKLLEIGWH